METNSTISVWPVIVCILVAICIGYCVYQYLSNKNPNKNNKSDNKVSEESRVADAILLEFKRIIKYFAGNMNALYDISINPDLSLARITFENIQQIMAVKGSDMLKKWYSDFAKDRNSWDLGLYKNKASELLNILKKCGICPHEEEKEFVWDDEFLKKYNRLIMIQPGQKCTVVAPYWIYNGEIFEKGLVKSNKSDN